MEVACYNYEGIDAVKNALRAGLEMSTEDMPIKVRDFLVYFGDSSFVTTQLV